MSTIYKFILRLLFLFTSIFFGNKLHAETPEKIQEINTLLDSLKTFQNDSLRLDFNNSVILSFQQILKPSISFSMITDSLKRMGMVESPDKKFRIYTWNVLLNDGTNRFFGFIQLNPEKTAECVIYPLKDISYTKPEKPTNRTFSPENWYGALYYQIVKVKAENKIVYTLMGSHFNDLFTNQKLIESLYFDDKNLPVFGFPIFELGLKLEKRVIFEYSVNAQMGLRYNESIDMIVFDHLAPPSPMYNGNYKFYGPDFSFDAYKFEKGRWSFVPNINPRNEKRTKAVKPIKRINSAPKK